MKQEIKECEDKLRGDDMKSVLGHEGINNMEDILSNIFSLTLPVVLTPSQINTESLLKMFGRLTVKKTTHGDEGLTKPSIRTHKKSHTSSEPDKKEMPSDILYVRDAYHDLYLHTEESSATESGKQTTAAESTTESTQAADVAIKQKIVSPSVSKKSSSDDSKQTESLKQRIPKSSVRVLLDARRWCPSIVYAGSGWAWVQTGDKKLQLINRRRAVKDTIDTNFAFNDITISPQGNLLLSDKDSNSIVSISGEKVAKTLFNTSTNTGWFKTSCKPHGLCYLHSGDIALTFADEGRVVIYSMSGKVIKELDKKLFRYPRKVAQSKINSDLYITDTDAKTFLCPGKVVALNKNYEVRFEYAGPEGREIFSPFDLCSDDAGNVLITDYNYNTIHILDEDGHVIRYLEGLREPYSIDADRNVNAWIGNVEGVKLVKYLQ